MKIFVDDMRPCPQGWTLAEHPDEAIYLLEECTTTHISLDYDGQYKWMDIQGYYRGIMQWILDRTEDGPEFIPYYFSFHTANPDGLREYKIMFRDLKNRAPFVEQIKRICL